MSTAIKLKAVTKLYGNLAAVSNLDLEIGEGEILGLIGPNGAGKTTTLKMIAGLLIPTSGTIEVMGHYINKNSSIPIKKHTGYLPEESPLYENMTVLQYLIFFSELYGLPRLLAKERIDSLLQSLKLTEKDKYTGELSKGMKRKVAIARTLLHDPSLLILDEPNAGLDPTTSVFIMDYFKKLNNRGKTIVLSAHNLSYVEYICNRVAVMKNGEIYLCDTLKSIRERLGQREYEAIFKADMNLGYERQGDNYVFRTADIRQIASLLEQISESNWTLIDLSVRQSALEEVYVKLIADVPDS